MKQPPKRNEDIWVRYCEDCINAKLENPKRGTVLYSNQLKLEKKDK
jgi:hypothetical protein